jgi:protoheme IX farnesyltransferase
MLPVTHGVAFTADRILAYAFCLFLLSVMPVVIGMSGWVYALGVPWFGGRFVWFAWRLRGDSRWAMPTFRYSIVYLSAIFALLLVDHGAAAWLARP